MKRVVAVVLAVFGGIGTAQAATPPAKVTAELAARLSAGGSAPVWVYFADKGATLTADAFVTPRARARRLLRGQPGRAAVDAQLDAPVNARYVESVARLVSRVRHQSRWLDAVSVEATPRQLEAVAALPFVTRLDVVRVSRRRPEEPVVKSQSWLSTPSTTRTTTHLLDYGSSIGQLEQIDVPAVHDSGLHGEGILIAMLDAGWDNLSHEAFASTAVADRHDFVNNDDDVANGIDAGEGSHGTMTLSVIGGFRPGRLIGPAFASTYLLAKTENTDTETPVEEDNWAAAAEWAEARGADVISSSLGYTTFDPGFGGYTPQQLDGHTAISTLAAELAVERGVVVVNSAGNDGFDSTHNTLGAPSDGIGVLAVGAVTSTGARTSFSSVGPAADGRIKPDVAAQGQAVTAAVSFGPSSYGQVDGTSFSCPLTAGVVALVLQAHPTWMPAQVGAALKATASQAASPDNLLGFGIVDAARAIQQPDPIVP